MTTNLPDRLVVVVGTYEGVLAGWDTIVDEKQHDEDPPKDSIMKKSETSLELLFKDRSEQNKTDGFLKLKFAMPVHEGSVRSVCIASGLEKSALLSKHHELDDKDHNASLSLDNKKRKRIQNSSDSGKSLNQENSSIQGKDVDKSSQHEKMIPEIFLSAGYDETVAIFSLSKHIQSGELKTPSDLGTPTSSCFAPPMTAFPTHALIGMSSGKIIIYKRKDWTVQHILSGHDDRGITCLAVHPTGKMALSGGKDGKIILWDLVKGRSAFVYKIPNPNKGVHSTVNDIVWSNDGNRYAFCTHDGKVTARDVASGKDLLDIQLPLRANQIAFVGGSEGMFLAAACDDGSLPVFLIEEIDDGEEETETRRAIMAIEPVVGPSAGDERFKCIRSVNGRSGFLVVTANSGGCVSLIDLENAAKIIMEDDGDREDEEKGGEEKDEEDIDDDIQARRLINRKTNIDSDSDDGDDEDFDLAARILDSVKLGTGARITCLSVWSSISVNSKPNGLSLGEDNNYVTNKDIDEPADQFAGPDTVDEPFTKKRNKSRSRESAKEMTFDRGLEDMDEKSLEKARALVKQAKKHQKRMEKKKTKTLK